MTAGNNIDEETMCLIYRIQLEELEELQGSFKGKHPENTPTDKDVAFDAYKRELQKYMMNLSDRYIAQSIAQAVQTDGPVVSALVRAERSATRDRALACRLAGRPQPSVAAEEPVINDQTLVKLAALNVYRSNNEEKAESSKTAQLRESTDRTCEICEDTYKPSELGLLPCRHEYCGGCLQDLFRASMRDETLFPPRCCGQAIPMAKIRDFLTAELADDFTAKKEELETPIRTYCSSKSCSAFIPTSNVKNDVAECPKCNKRTCTMCKDAAHRGDCPQDNALGQLLETAVASGWQRCYNCRSVVELNIGCNHITCRCGAQFCYVCGRKWKHCPCAQWDENRLLARANDILNRGPRNNDQSRRHRRFDGDHRANAVQNMMQHLRDRHECSHDSWRTIEGSHRCEICSDQLPEFILECLQCRLLACLQCKRNRRALALDASSSST